MKKIILALFFLSAISTNAVRAHEDAVMAQDSITVIGEGFVDAEPDMLDLRVELFSVKTTLKDAKLAVDQQYRDALKAIKQHKIADVDIKLTRINSQAEYEWDKQKQTFKGYRVSRNVQIAVRNVSVYPELLQSLVDSNISNINGVTPRFSDDTSIKEQALTVAVASAKRKAASLAKQFDRSLGKITYISEGRVDTPTFQPMLVQSRSMKMQAPPAMLGTQRVSASVTVIYRLQ